MSEGDEIVRITLTEFYAVQMKQNKELSESLGDIKTAIAVLFKGNTPVEDDIKNMKKDVIELQRKIWQLPSLATIISLAGLVVAILAMNSK